MFLACTPLRAQRRLELGRLHYKLFSFNGWYAKCCTTYWSVARSATDDDAWMSRRRPPAPPTSMLIPAFTRGPGWCNILHVGSWCSKGRSPSTLSPGGTGGRRTKKRTFTKEQEKWCNILHVNRTGCRGRLLAPCFRPEFGVAGCFSADVDVSRASLDF